MKDIGAVGQVACGSVHTVAVAQDGKTVWSFGSGDNGRLVVVCLLYSGRGKGGGGGLSGLWVRWRVAV